MALSNYERVGKALEILKNGLSRYIAQEMRNVYFDEWQTIAAQSTNPSMSAPPQARDWQECQDVLKLLIIMWNQWDKVFSRTLGYTERSIVSELRETRNKWAHQNAFSTNDAQRALDSVERLLNAISATDEAKEVEKMRMDLLRIQFDEQRRNEMRKASFQPTEGKPYGGLRPWREVVTPHPDVATGRYQQAEFAADLWQVYLHEASDEYQNPVEFFRRTFLTEGLSELLKRGIQRLSGAGGDPVVELQTNFGGGKTHSMLALYHLFSNTPASELQGVEKLLTDGLSIPKNVRRVVIVGTKISPGQPSKKPDGIVVRTLWGEIAWQLGGKEGYEMVREDDERATNPGDRLKELFNKYSPCLILIDEWVAYARQLHEGSDLPAGSFETQFTFAQTLSESAKAAKKTMLVVSIPASDNEVGGDWGKAALARLKNAIGRVESPWRPASPDEGFEIVRRRLFQPLTNDQSIARDAVARAFVDMYGDNYQEFPSQCRESKYEHRIRMAYPIHPELFDRLYNDWSTLDKFQRTRGVLRLMAAVIYSLWHRQDNNLLIMPAMIPVDDPNVQFELTRYLEDQWVPVIESEVDGPRSLSLKLEGENPSLGRYSACRRVSRTIYIGSAPTVRLANRGIDDKSIKLGCVQPGENPATFGDALRRLSDSATYLYVDGTRYWYSTQPTVTRLADDRAAQQNIDTVWEEIRNRLKEGVRDRGDFSKVHVCVESDNIPDERDARLVVIGPESPHTSKDMDSPAIKVAKDILQFRGSSPRQYRNTLAFLVADSNRLKDLEQAVRQYLAWKSIIDQKEELNLDQFQTKQAQTKLDNADNTVDTRIPETYQWLILPSQPDPKAEIEWSDYRLQGHDGLAVRTSKKMKNDGTLLVHMGGSVLRHELDKIPLWRGNHVSVNQLIDDFATYLYLPRLKDEEVLKDAISNGLSMISWETDSFAYADGWDENDKRYKGLREGYTSGYSICNEGLIVKPDVASIQLEAAKRKKEEELTPNPVPGITGNNGSGRVIDKGNGIKVPDPAVDRRFYARAKIDPTRMIKEVNDIANGVVQLLARENGSDVDIIIEINVRLPKSASEKLKMDVTENCRTLKFQTYEFESE